MGVYAGHNKRGGALHIFNKRFYGELNGYTLGDMYDFIDYSITDLDGRLEQTYKAQDTGFFQEYFDNVYNPHLTKKDGLSHTDSVCQCLERMADYILSSDEEIARKAADKEYIYFRDRSHLKRKLNKELNFSSILSKSKAFSEIILNNIMEDSVGRIALPKDVTVTNDDLEGDSVMSQCLRGYQNLIDYIDNKMKNGEGNRKNLSVQKYHLKQDMITVKRCFKGIDKYKHDNINKIHQANKDFDLTKKETVYGFTYEQGGNRHFVQGLIFYEKPEGLDINDPFSVALYDIQECLDNSEYISARDRRLIYLLRKGVPRKTIGTILGIDESTVSRDIHRVVKIIMEGCKYE